MEDYKLRDLRAPLTHWVGRGSGRPKGGGGGPTPQDGEAGNSV